VPAKGGQPQRLTWHPDNDIPLDWTPDGSAVAFVSRRETDHGRSGQLYHASLDGSFPEKQMEARIYRGTYNEVGDLAYIAFGSGYNGLFGGGSGWKGYRGGTTPAVQIMNAARTEVTTIPGAGTTNFNPMWLDGKVYFLSDRDDKIFNLFSYDPGNGKLEKISAEPTWDIRAASGHGSSIVYEAGGRLKQFDLASGTSSEIVIEIAPDLPQLRPQWKNAAGTIQASDISTSGKRAVVTARGEVFTVPVTDGSTRNLSNTGTVMARRS
jgi:tricorn protease